MQCNHYYQEISACHCLKFGYAVPPDSCSQVVM